MARIEAISPTACLQAKPRWQFSIRSFLLLTGIIALVIARWPVREQHWQFHAAFAALTMAVLATIALAPAAWRIARDRRTQQADQRMASPVTNETTALGFGIGAVLTYGTIWLLSMCALDKPSNPFLQGLVVIGFVFAVALCPLLVLGNGLSFFAFWGFAKNRPLFALRIIGLIANVVLVWWAIVGTG